MCNKIPMLSTCCKWNGTGCIPDKYSTICWDSMEEPPEGAMFCDDYNSWNDETLCKKIAGDPWYMPCEWNNNTERCKFKEDDVFGTGEKNILKLENRKNCEAAGGQWVTESYCQGNATISTGRCEMKFEEKTNCNLHCSACDYKSDRTAWSSLSKAKKACMGSDSGICDFTEDSTAENGYGKCRVNEEIKKGIAGDCDDDCASCYYYGSPSAEDSADRPSSFCRNSDAKCKWIPDADYPNDESKGKCAPQTEKTCEDKCTKCGSQKSCVNKGAKGGDTGMDAQCKWDETDGCLPQSGADQMEICDNGKDDNSDGKIDCADSMCFGECFAEFTDVGLDCFGYNDETSCSDAGCVWMSETWGEWCDMPGANCYSYDGTNQTACEAEGCDWHSGFGGFCEENWDKGSNCMDLSQSDCEGSSGQINNCTWVIDDYCSESGGYCDPDPNYEGEWYDCIQHDMDGNATCETAGTEDSSGVLPCNWYLDSWCESQGDSAGYCDHVSFACFQYDENKSECQANSDWCMWITDDYSPSGGYCEGKMMSGGEDSCWSQSNQTLCENAGCTWMSGFCDPPGFGGEMMPGMGGGEMQGMGGMGMSCFKHDGNQTACEGQLGCGWFSESQPFCDIDFSSDCPQYSYSQSACENATLTGGKCIWNSQGGFCDEKPFECHWNETLESNLSLCDAHALCQSTGNDCEPICFSKGTSESCSGTSGCRWITGWCDPANSAQFFGKMEGGAPIPLGTDASNDVSQAEIDITGFGLKDLPDAYGFGVQVRDVAEAAACNNKYIASLGNSGNGDNTTKFYWYIDSDGNDQTGCDSRDNEQSGFEYYFSNSWVYDTSTQTVNENPKAYKCSGGSWTTTSGIVPTSSRQKMCSEVGGAMIAVEKGDINVSADNEMRVYVASAGKGKNETNPDDYVDNVGYATAGAYDFSFDDFNMYGFESDKTKSNSKAGMDKGYVDNSEINCFTQAGCANWECEGHKFCVENQYGVEAQGYTDTKTPLVQSMYKETYPDAVFMALFTDKLANTNLSFYGTDSSCKSLNASVSSDALSRGMYELKDYVEIYDRKLGYDLSESTVYYYKIKICDENGKCGSSKCSNFTTEPADDCGFCNFVTRINKPSTWEIYYDLDADNTYEHWQGNECSPKAGMKTNYTTGRGANIKLMKSDNSSYFEFLNVRLTKTGTRPKIRNISGANALEEGTATTSSGATIGYVGMIEKTRDKIINNLFPEKCHIKVPGSGNCNKLYHCDNNGENCVDRTSEATLNSSGSSYCVWEIPCEFSRWYGGEPGDYTAATTTDDDSDSGGGGGGGSVIAGNATGGRAASYVYSGTASAGDKISFSIKDKEFRMELIYVTEEVTRISFEGYRYFTLDNEEMAELDIDEDGTNDVMVKSTYVEDNVAKLSLKQLAIKEEVEAAPPKEEAAGLEEAPAEEEEAVQPPEEHKPEALAGPEEPSRSVAGGIIAAVALVALVVLLVLKAKRKDQA